MKQFLGKMENGFTIIELVISIFVLSVGIVGIFSVFSMVTILTSSTTDRLTATYLAQEGQEIVRNIRDTNWLNMDAYYCTSEIVPEDTDTCPASWLDGLALFAANGIDCTNGCEADYTSNSMLGGSGNYLYLNGDGFYDYTNDGINLPTKFKRKITITQVTDVDEDPNHIIKVIVQVSWDKKATILSQGADADDCNPENCIITESTLYDWYNYVHH